MAFRPANQLKNVLLAYNCDMVKVSKLTFVGCRMKFRWLTVQENSGGCDNKLQNSTTIKHLHRLKHFHFHYTCSEAKARTRRGNRDNKC